MHIAAPLQSTPSSSFDWLDQVAARFNGERNDAYCALRAVLTTLRDALPVESAVALAIRIPLLIRGVFFDGYEPARPPIRLNDVDAFVGEVERRLQAKVSSRLTDMTAIDAEVAVDAVIAVLAGHLDPATAATIRKSLPASVQSRWSQSELHV